MKRRVFHYLLILALIGGCATETKVVDNTFYSSYPKLEVTVSPEFEYVHQQGIKTDAESHGGFDYTAFSRLFTFIDLASERLVAISITKAPSDGYWLAPSMALDTIKDKLAYGKCKLGRHTYDYCIYWENGNLAKMHLRNASVDAFRVMLLYVEPKTNYQSLNSDQEILEAFNKKCQAAFTVTGARHKRADKEKQQLAYIPESVIRPRIQMRDQPRELSIEDVKNMLSKYNFYDKDFNPEGSFANSFRDNLDGTVTDRATGLMWLLEAPLIELEPSTLWNAESFLEILNKERFAGYSDWRLPTIEELASLMSPWRVKGLYLSPVFSGKQSKFCYSADTRNTGSYWSADYNLGILTTKSRMYVTHPRILVPVKAVRSLE